jgi:L-ascorbate metabolism protein UlaG (beta-lactamase superfamily)
VTASVRWIGHASALVEIDDERVLIDPLGRKRCRAVGDYSTILITHAHADHLNRWTLSKLDKSATLVVPMGATHIVADLGFARVVEAEPGDHFHAGKLDVIAVQTKHDSGRWRKGDAPICTGYIVTKNDVSIHHAGDIDMSGFEVFDELGAKHQVDATLLPIGGMLPVWYYRWRRKALDRGIHIDPDTALEIAERLGAKAMVPVHWGTVNLRLGPASAPKRRLTQIATERGVDGLVRVLDHGEQLLLGSTSEVETVHEEADDPDS